MSIVQLKSDNKDFSFIISKNPNSGLMAKPLKKGVLFGYFTEGKESEFNVYFKDGSDEVSFPSYEGETFEYLNTSRYNSASFVVNSIDEMFRTAFKSNKYKTPEGEKEGIDGAESTFFINMIHIRNKRYISAFKDYFPDFNVEAEVVSGKNYRITIKTKKTIYELLNFASLFAIFQAIVNEEPMYVNEENATKYINCMNIVDAPYFTRYLFKIRFLENFKLFRGVKDLLSQNKKQNIEMTLGNTWQARQMAIQERLSFKNNILDVGCGEGKYITRFNRFMKDLKYFAVDIDPVERAKAERRVKQKDFKNVTFFNSALEFLESGNNENKIDVILTEVIEHMSIKEAKELIELIVENINFDRFIITTPNSDFNKNYFMEGFRHHDHKFEFSRKEFENFINEISSGYSFIESDFFDIGDYVDGDTPSQGVILMK